MTRQPRVLLFALPLLLCHIYEASADLRVLESTTPGLPPGTVLLDDARLDIAAGAQIKLLRLPAATTVTITGPHTGTLADYERRPKSLWERWFGASTPAKDEPYGGVRGGKR